ncbi:MAG: hypothetical protein IJ035_07765 [Oscillospiraceae bacterium]|nr:hypothetical protein [Oscillospiraceae bacterium]
MTFKCTACEKNVKLNRANNIAYDDMMEWSDFNSIDDVPPLSEGIWQRSENTPIAGCQRFVRVKFPFNYETGEEFNVLFMPAWSMFNGWEEYPEEIPKSAIVHCRFDEAVSSDEKYAWIIITVLNVLPLGEICEKYSPIRKPSFKSDNDNHVLEFTYENYMFYSNSAWRNWSLVYIDDSGEKHMILDCIWDEHETEVWFGNMIFDKW